MEVTQADFRQHYELLSDDALLEINAEDLVDVARQCLEEEIANRGLNVAADDDLKRPRPNQQRAKKTRAKS